MSGISVASTSLTNSALRSYRRLRAYVARTTKQFAWSRNGWPAPAPQRVKLAVLARYGKAADSWVETGTYLGDTTATLAQWATAVISLEPEPKLAAAAAMRFRGVPSVRIVPATSEAALPAIMAGLEGSVSLWLDGHYSAGVTFLGEHDTPILNELATVEQHLARLTQVNVFIDDMRCFDPSISQYSSYPTRGALVSWAERNGLRWTIEHDIFIAQK